MKVDTDMMALMKATKRFARSPSAIIEREIKKQEAAHKSAPNDPPTETKAPAADGDRTHPPG